MVNKRKKNEKKVVCNDLSKQPETILLTYVLIGVPPCEDDVPPSSGSRWLFGSFFAVWTGDASVGDSSPPLVADESSPVSVGS